MTDKQTNEEKGLKKYKAKRENVIFLVVYCFLFAGLGALVFLGGVNEATMYQALKSDKYLTDDGLPYRDMANATYTYPAAEIDKLAESSNWMMAFGALVFAASIIILFAILWIAPEKKEIHMMLCKGQGEKEYCSECGLKLSKLEKE